MAKHANVSTATVSRTLNHQDDLLSPETRERVLAAIQELGFVPNSMARGLHSNRTKTIGLIIQDVANPYYASIVKGVEDAAQELDYTVILANVHRSKQRTTHYLNVLREKRVDGIIFAGGGVVRDAGSDEFFEQNRIATVVIGKSLDVQRASVQIDNAQAACEACEYLIKLGHSKIATITGPEYSTTAVDRTKGYRQALANHGIIPRDEWIIQGNFEYESGYQAAGKLLQLAPETTGIFAQNDMMGIGVIKALREKGYDVPNDISVIGFDDIPLASFITPMLSTIAVPIYDIGKAAMQVLSRKLSGDEVQPVTVLPTKLVPRESCQKL